MLTNSHAGVSRYIALFGVAIAMLQGVAAIAQTDPSADPTQTPDPVAVQPEPSTPAPSTEAHGVPTVDAPALEKVVKDLHGKVVVVNFFATWNESSGREVPYLVGLYNHYKPLGVVVVAVSGDKPEVRDSRVIPFLNSTGATFPAYILSDNNIQAVLKGVDTSWTGTLPRTYVVDKNGKVRLVSARQFLPGQVETLVKALVREEAKPLPTPKPGEKSVEIPHPNGFLGR